MLRTVYFWTVITLSTIIALFVIALSLPFDKEGRAIRFYANIWGRLNLYTSGVKLQVSGLENIIKDKPQIFMANHQSIYDILALITLPLHFTWIAKKELFRIPFLGWAMVLAGCVSIDKFNPRNTLGGMDYVHAKIQKGASIMIFPEGTRSYDGMLQPFKKGGFTLAMRAKIPIVPITLTGTGKVMQRGTRKVRPGNIKIIIDKPIETLNLGLKDRGNLIYRVHEVISRNLS
ncbi:MAG: lysophospholipid acyltransferase family protein [Thermodesulfobacteriota bacterium]